MENFDQIKLSRDTLTRPIQEMMSAHCTVRISVQIAGIVETHRDGDKRWTTLSVAQGRLA